jgi:hypothetical protein
MRSNLQKQLNYLFTILKTNPLASHPYLRARHRSKRKNLEEELNIYRARLLDEIMKGLAAG